MPVFNEADNIGLVIDRLLPVLGRCAASFEVIFIDDGSSDATLDVLRRANAEDRRIRAVSFSRNFGKEIAIAAGLDHAEGEAVVIMDADLQHPPELIESFVARWREGYKNVFGTRVNRAGETVLRRILAHRFYRHLRKLRRDTAARGRRRLPPARPAGRRGFARHGRAGALLEGPLCLDRLQIDRRPVRGRAARPRRDEIQLSQADPLRARRNHVVLDHAVAGVELCGHGDLGHSL